MEWKNGIKMTSEEIENVRLLRAAGCKCELPLLGYIPNQGPRCRMCNVEAFANQQIETDDQKNGSNLAQSLREDVVTKEDAKTICHKDKTTMNKIINKCKEEIEWAQASIDEMNLPGNPHNYQDDDRVWLPCWLKAHAEMLNLITSASTVPETSPASDD